MMLLGAFFTVSFLLTEPQAIPGGPPCPPTPPTVSQELQTSAVSSSESRGEIGSTKPDRLGGGGQGGSLVVGWVFLSWGGEKWSPHSQPHILALESTWPLICPLQKLFAFSGYHVSDSGPRI